MDCVLLLKQKSPPNELEHCDGMNDLISGSIDGVRALARNVPFDWDLRCPKMYIRLLMCLSVYISLCRQANMLIDPFQCRLLNKYFVVLSNIVNNIFFLGVLQGHNSLESMRSKTTTRFLRAKTN